MSSEWTPKTLENVATEILENVENGVDTSALRKLEYTDILRWAADEIERLDHLLATERVTSENRRKDVLKGLAETERLRAEFAETKEGWRLGIEQKRVNAMPETEAAVYIAELQDEIERLRADKERAERELE